MTTFWLITVEGGVEPEVQGPYTTAEMQIDAAKAFRRASPGYRPEVGEDDGLFWLDINERGVPIAGAFDPKTFEEVR